MSNVYQNMRDSMARVEIARPIISELLKGGEIHPVEGDDNVICKLLDTLCGTDWFQVYENIKLVQGIASRTQVIRNGLKPYNSFTVRKEIESGNITEYQKRRLAIDHGGVYPYLTMQLYVDSEDRPLSIGIAKTEDVMDFIDKGYARSGRTGYDQERQATFYICDWSRMQDKGYTVRTWHKDE